MADTRRAEDIKRQFDLTMKAFEKNVSETVESYEKAVKPLSEKISKTNKDFEISKTSIEKNLKSIGVNTEKFFKTITKEANKTGKSVAEVMNKYFGDREEYITDELKLLKAREKKANLSWRGQKTLSGRLKGLIGLQLKDLKEKSPILSTLSGIKDFVIGNKNAMLENEKEVLSTNQEILEITRKRQKEDEDNQKNIKAAYIAKKEAELKKNALEIKYARFLEENLYSSLSDKTKERKRLEMFQDIEGDRRYKKMAEARYKFEADSPKTDIKKTTGKMPEEQKVQVSNNKLMKKMVTSLSKIEDGLGGKLSGMLGMLIPSLLGLVASVAALRAAWLSLGSKNPTENALGTLKMIPKIGTLLKGFITKKIGAKVLPKIGGKLGMSFLKKIPGIGAIAAVILGIERFEKGETLKGTMEILSGLASIFPGYGTVASLVIDSALMFMDYKDIGQKQFKESFGASALTKKMNLIDKSLQKKHGESKIGKFFTNFGELFAPTNNIPPKTKLAKGGVVTRPTNALIGDAGPEAVIPLKKYIPTAVGEKTLERIKEDDRKQEILMGKLMTFLKNDFASVLAKKIGDNIKKATDGKGNSAFSGYNFGNAGA